MYIESILMHVTGLTIQRKSHLENEALPISVRKRDHRRPLWLIGFTVFICANVLGNFALAASLSHQVADHVSTQALYSK